MIYKLQAFWIYLMLMSLIIHIQKLNQCCCGSLHTCFFTHTSVLDEVLSPTCAFPILLPIKILYSQVRKLSFFPGRQKGPREEVQTSMTLLGKWPLPEGQGSVGDQISHLCWASMEASKNTFNLL